MKKLYINTQKEENYLISILNDWQLNLEDIDWDNLLKILNDHKILPYFYQNFYENIPINIISNYTRQYNQFSVETDFMFSKFLKIANLINKNKINAVIIKGIVLSQMLYGNIYARKSFDIDILIDEKDVNKMHHLLLEIGFVHCCGLKNPYDLKSGMMILSEPTLKAYKHHEYFCYYFQYENGKYLIVELQRHIHSTITEQKLIAEFIRSNQMINVNGHKIPTLDNEHTLLYLLESIYTDSEWFYRGPKLNKFLDVFNFIKKKHINWDKLLNLSNYYKLYDVCLYSLNKANELFDNSLIITYEPYFNNFIEEPFTVDWDINLLKRFFTNDTSRRVELKKKLKAICYSDSNPHWKEPYKVPLINNTNFSLSFIDFKFNSYNTFRVYQNNNNIYFEIELDNKILDALTKYDLGIIIDFFESNISSDGLISESIKVNLKDNACNYQNSENNNGVVVDNNRCIISVPKVNLKFKENKIGFLIGLEEKVLIHTYYALSPNFYYDKEVWRKIPILEV